MTAPSASKAAWISARSEKTSRWRPRTMAARTLAVSPISTRPLSTRLIASATSTESASRRLAFSRSALSVEAETPMYWSYSRCRRSASSTSPETFWPATVVSTGPVRESSLVIATESSWITASKRCPVT